MSPRASTDPSRPVYLADSWCLICRLRNCGMSTAQSGASREGRGWRASAPIDARRLAHYGTARADGTGPGLRPYEIGATSTDRTRRSEPGTPREARRPEDVRAATRLGRARGSAADRRHVSRLPG